ncbi:MAG: flagellar hook basal-body protein [Candidatus Magnetomorum sp.]|nr:flagellar hook basal-body protein [Candidatus Magnetomorum sp.]
MSDVINSAANYGLSMAVRSSLSQDARYDMIANNLANIETPGFKGDMLSFDKTLDEVITTDFTDGQMHHTGNPLDVSVNDGLFFSVETPAGTRFTRNGSFTLNAEGMLITSNGHPVLGQNGPINITGTDIVINEAGEVIADGQRIDTLKIIDFGGKNIGEGWIFGEEGSTLESLKKEGSSYFNLEGETATLPQAENVKVSQGTLEQSNVDTMAQMIKLIETQRSFEAYHKIINTFMETDTKAVTDVGRLG